MTHPRVEYTEFTAWDVPTRWFHWINALGVVGLIGTGLVILNDDALGLSSERQGVTETNPCLFRLCDGRKSPLAFRVGLLWQSVRAVARDFARRPRLSCKRTNLYIVVFVRRTTAVRRAQPTGANWSIAAIFASPHTVSDRARDSGNRPVLAAVRALVCPMDRRPGCRPVNNPAGLLRSD